MVDRHQHAPCNGVTCCTVCHAWIHAHPFEARAEGWIVARHADPCHVEVKIHGKMVLLAHDSATRFVITEE